MTEQKLYAAIRGAVIYGVGTSELGAVQDARQYGATGRLTVTQIDAITYEDVLENGWNSRMTCPVASVHDNVYGDDNE